MIFDALYSWISFLLLQHAKARKAKKTEGGDIFAAKKEEYKVSDARKADQETVDKQVLAAMKKHPEGASLKAYMKAIFSLSKGQFPHTMAFWILSVVWVNLNIKPAVLKNSSWFCLKKNFKGFVCKHSKMMTKYRSEHTKTNSATLKGWLQSSWK